jgi:hypothetical protein
MYYAMRWYQAEMLRVNQTGTGMNRVSRFKKAGSAWEVGVVADSCLVRQSETNDYDKHPSYHIHNKIMSYFY